jgi:hypothetical protein
VRAFERRDGSLLILAEDSWAQKQIVYRLPARAVAVPPPAD